MCADGWVRVRVCVRARVPAPVLLQALLAGCVALSAATNLMDGATLEVLSPVSHVVEGCLNKGP